MTGFRKTQDNRNLDDLRVMVIGVMVAILLLVATPKSMQVWDFFGATRPFITATIQVVRPEFSDKPMILYDVDATQNVDGFWIASIVDGRGVHITTRRGQGSYNSRADEPKLWTWFAFFDNDKGLNDPGYPNVPFRVCVRYIITARDSGVSDETDEYCSNIFSP